MDEERNEQENENPETAPNAQPDGDGGSAPEASSEPVQETLQDA